MQTWFATVAALALLVYLLASRRRPREAPLPWGTSIARERDMRDFAAGFHAGRRPRDGVVDDRTWADLGMDALFARLDRCISSVGQRRLYARLRMPSFAAAKIAAFDQQVSAFAGEAGAALRSAVERALRPLGSACAARDLGPLLHAEPPALPRGHRLFPVASAITFAAGVLALVWPLSLVLLLACFAGNIAIRVALHHTMTLHLSALAAVADLVQAGQKLARIDADTLGPEVHALRAAVATVGGLGPAIRWVRLEPLRMDDLTGGLVAYLNVLFLLDVCAFGRSLALVRQHRGALGTIFDTVGDLDAARAIASFRAEAAWSAPAFAPPGAPIVAAGMTHPLLPASTAVPNDVVLDPGKGWLVLGSNMSGKSTFLRALGLQALLAQTVATVTCTAYRAPLLSVRTLIHVEDDLVGGRSHFLVEAEAACAILVDPAANDRLCIVDELFRGTNTTDRVAAGAAFLRALAASGAAVVAATHDAELVGLLAERYAPHHFQEVVGGAGEGTIAFDYRLRAGGDAPRNALRVLALAGFPREVLRDAQGLAGG